MDNGERRKQLEERLKKAVERAKKGKEKIKSLRGKLKALDAPKELTSKQQNMIKIWHGVACMALMKENQELAKQVHDYLDKNVKSPRQRHLMGLFVEETSECPNAEYSRIFNRTGPVFALERIDLVVPFPEPAEERQKAKAAGARWDGERKVWYVEKGFDLTRVEAWLPKQNWASYGLI